MKSIIRVSFSFFAAMILAAACQQEAQPVRYTAPEVRINAPSETIVANVGEKVRFDADLLSGEKVSIAWYINDNIVSSAQKFDYVFQSPGDYTIKFEAVNGAGRVERSFSATVNDVFNVRLSTGDSLEIVRTHLDKLSLGAIVVTGENVSHTWYVDGVETSREAYLSTPLAEVKNYQIRYHGQNAAGSVDKNIVVKVNERPLEVVFSVPDKYISTKRRTPVSVTATAIYGVEGLAHQWTIADEVVSTAEALQYEFTETGTFELKYLGVNAKGEKVERSWQVSVLSATFLLDDFETGDALKSWWTLKQNDPGITLVDNPDKSGINTSAKCARDFVYGTGGTSGYFDLKGTEITASGVADITQYNGIKIKVHLGLNKYYPRIEVGGVKYAPVHPPKFENKWEELEYVFPANFKADQKITFRPLLKENGSNIDSGAVTETNTRSVYFDDIEFFN